MFQNLISDFTVNAWWELIAVIMLTSIARIFRLTFGKKMTTRHEIMFWSGCIVCGTVALAVINVGIIKPIDNQLSNKSEAQPFLHCEIGEVVIGALSPKGIPSSVTFMLRVVNSGAPSIAWKWHAKVELPTGQTFESDAEENPQTVINHIFDTNTFPNFEADKDLPALLLESPLPTGNGKLGWVMFKFNDISYSDMQHIGTKFTIQFEDSTGRITTQSYTAAKNMVNVQ